MCRAMSWGLGGMGSHGSGILILLDTCTAVPWPLLSKGFQLCVCFGVSRVLRCAHNTEYSQEKMTQSDIKNRL